MYHPTTRVLTVLELLQARGQIGGQELARRLEVDPRTVRRYIGMLQELGMPIESKRGRYGMYRLRPGFKLPPLMFTGDEALAVVLGLLMAHQAGVSDATPAVAGALAKIVRVMPVDLREQAEALRESIILAPTDIDAVARGAHILTLGMAVRERRRVWARHTAFGGAVTEREIDPYGLVHRSGRWYLAGYCHLRRDLRVFRLDRLDAIDLRDATFTPPDDIDCLALVERAIAQTPGEWTAEVLLRATLAEARREISVTLGLLEEVEEGVVLRCYTNNLNWMARSLAYLTMPFRIISPPELRDAVRQLAATLASALAP